MLEVSLLGTFGIYCNAKPIAISSRAAQSLFAYLVLTAGTAHRREKLAGMFWPDVTEDKARAYLRRELWLIRKALSSRSKTDYLIADDINIYFNASTEYWLDVTALVKISESASIDELINALSVYQGELLPGFYENWVTQEREHLQAVNEQKMTRLLELLEKEQRWHDILEWAERWISIGEKPEAAYRYLMIAYDAMGDRSKVFSTYQRCVQALRELDLEPSEQTRTLAFKKTSKLNIPVPLTSFIGREKELKEVADLLSKSRLVTLTGSGGVGKTRLAIQVVADVLDRFPDEVWFLDLAPLSDPALVPNTLAHLLGLRESGEAQFVVTDLLINYFSSRTALVIFDNCEHLIESSAQLIHLLLTSCKALSILATSREVLRVSGETPYRVPSLEVPPKSVEETIRVLANTASVKLFVERAVVVSPGFAITPHNVLDIAQICQRLDGIPLAIELAVARVNMLSAEQILKRLDDRFNILTSGFRTALPRHQTLRATIEWSYDLLPEKERILFRRLAVFAGGWTFEAAEEVCSGNGIESGDILDLLSQLVNKSLVMVETAAGEIRYPTRSSLRYHKLETIRQFALAKLIETGEAAQLQDRHLEYFLKKAETIEPFLMGAEQSAWMDYLDIELDNMRLALERSISKDRGDESLRLFGALGWYWFMRCHFREGETWFKQAYKLRNKASKFAQARALRNAAFLRYVRGDYAGTISFHQESLDLYRDLDDQTEMSTTLQFLGVVESQRGNIVQARSLLEESLRLSRQINNKPAIPRVLMNLGIFTEAEGDYTAAWRYYEESLAIAREVGEGHLIMVILSIMGNFELAQNKIPHARKYYEEALKIGIELKNDRAVAETLLDFTKILFMEERYSESARLQGLAHALLSKIETLAEWHLVTIREIADTLITQLGDDVYQKEFNIGKTLGIDQAAGLIPVNHTA